MLTNKYIIVYNTNALRIGTATEILCTRQVGISSYRRPRRTTKNIFKPYFHPRIVVRMRPKVAAFDIIILLDLTISEM